MTTFILGFDFVWLKEFIRVGMGRGGTCGCGMVKKMSIQMLFIFILFIKGNTGIFFSNTYVYKYSCKVWHDHIEPLLKAF